jgi:hypothetical protein
MRLRDNAPGIFFKFQDQNLRTPSIEDGNPTDNTEQGKIFTSEIDSTSGYSIDYAATITGWNNTKNSTGGEISYLISFTYDVDYLQAIPVVLDNPGQFGSDIIKENDIFLIWSRSGSNDYVRGFVSKIIDIVTTPYAGPPAGVTYDIVAQVTVTQGTPNSVFADVTNGDIFLWKRQRFQDETTFQEAYPPVNLKMTKDDNGNLYAYWDDINEESRRYRIYFRNPTTYPPSGTIYNVLGSIANSNTSLSVFLDETNPGAGQLTSIKINQPGVNMHSDRSVDIIGTGTGATARTNLDPKGSLTINEYVVKDATSLGAINTAFQLTPFGQPIATFTNTTIPPGPLANGVYVGCPSTSTGAGIGATFNITVASGAITSITLNNPGTRYRLTNVLTIAGTAFGGASPADDLTITLNTLVPTSYINVASTSAGPGIGATFNVTYNSLGVGNVAINNPGWGYTPGNPIYIANALLGGPPATDYLLSAGNNGPTIRVYSQNMREGYSDYPVPNVRSYVEGLPAAGNTTDYYVGSVSQIMPGNNRYLYINVYDAKTGSPVLFPLGYVMPNTLKTHDGIELLTVGSGYTKKARANVKVIPNDVRWFYDSSVFGPPPISNTWPWSVCAIYDEINKKYTEWSIEDYIKF